MNVISYPTIKEFFEGNAASKSYLLDWYHTTKKANWNNVNEMRLDFPSAEMVVDNKVVFNIKANDFRLVAIVLFKAKRVQIIFIGTHADYSKVKIKDL
ncbi:type II toxin-antitoxin system HigB family toxin [Adhaeribacter aquaticus]|uniref:type II toxin-antitoxin system HigB family toxin n=1 Tax=Adhaeribacter aquaticus TaxID=299567 RepID=UPI000414ABB8|nr:type II toxin-antitoxin system HigB family toxin [Adhaeribacter aquaticus]